MFGIKCNGFLKGTSGDNKFTIKCDKCGSQNTYIDSDIGVGSEWTGMYGDISIGCEDCDNIAVIFE